MGSATGDRLIERGGFVNNWRRDVPPRSGLLAAAFLGVGASVLLAGHATATSPAAPRHVPRYASTSKGTPAVPTTRPAPALPPPTTAPEYVIRKPDPWPTGCCAPLTGMGYDDPVLAEMTTHVVKIDNSTPAPPHTNLQRADIVFELKVEDVSRFIAMYHSRLPEIVGPIRSARTSDPPVISPLGNPIVSFSGGNPNVRKVFHELPWLMDANAMVAGGWYFRNFEGRTIPHNLYVKAAGLRTANRNYGHAPPSLFAILQPGEANTAGEPVAEVHEQIGTVPSSFTWDAETRYWLRSEYGEPHTEVDGEMIGRRNVLFLATNYTESAADSRSPEAVTTGTGEAWMLIEDKLILGTWSRPTPESAWTLTANDGTPVKLAPGPTWVNLVDRAPRFGPQ